MGVPRNKIISPLTILVDREAYEDAGWDGKKAITDSVVWYFGSRNRPEGLGDRVRRSLEVPFRRMLSNCAVDIRIAYCYSFHESVPAGKLVKSGLSATIGKHIDFVDQKDRVWDAVVAYFAPVLNEFDDKPPTKFSTAIWNFYLIVLAAKYKAEVNVNPYKTRRLIEQVESKMKLSPEAHARLSVIKGIVNEFTVELEAPALKIIPGVSGTAISERIDEILEDAYLLEASTLRRAFGIKENRARIDKRLRKLLSFIQHHRGWAKGIVTTGSDIILGAQAFTPALGSLVDLVPGLTESSYPIFNLSDDVRKDFGETTVEFVRHPGVSNLTIDVRSKR